METLPSHCLRHILGEAQFSLLSHCWLSLPTLVGPQSASSGKITDWPVSGYLPIPGPITESRGDRVLGLHQTGPRVSSTDQGVSIFPRRGTEQEKTIMAPTASSQQNLSPEAQLQLLLAWLQ